MIFAQTKTGQSLIILEPANLKKIREGGTVHTPDDTHSIIIMYSPDVMWTAEQMKKEFDETGSLDVEAVQRILKESQSRPEVVERPYHHADVIRGKREGSTQ